MQRKQAETIVRMFNFRWATGSRCFVCTPKGEIIFTSTYDKAFIADSDPQTGESIVAIVVNAEGFQGQPIPLDWIVMHNPLM